MERRAEQEAELERRLQGDARDPLETLWITASEEDDLGSGQIVVVTARWILVATGLLLALWQPGTPDLDQLRITLVVVLVIAVGNFILHAQLLKRRRAIAPIAYLASAADITVISLLIAIQGGATSDVYVFYFPAILALAVSFPTALTAGYTLGAMILYTTLAGIGTAPETLVGRLVIIAGVAICGHIYRGIERDRRAESAKAQASLMEQLSADART